MAHSRHTVKRSQQLWTLILMRFAEWPGPRALVVISPCPLGSRNISNQDPCTLNWGYMVTNNRYLGPNRG